MSAVRDLPVPALFRPMREDDLDAVLQNEARSYSHPWTPAIFRDCLRAGYSCWLVGVGNDIIGHAVLSIAVGETHILNICVVPEWQGKGVGREFMHHLLALSRDYGARTAFLEVRQSNGVAIRLYESLGFSEVGQRPDYYPAIGGREDAIVMALELETPDFIGQS